MKYELIDIFGNEVLIVIGTVDNDGRPRSLNRDEVIEACRILNEKTIRDIEIDEIIKNFEDMYSSTMKFQAEMEKEVDDEYPSNIRFAEDGEHQ